MLGDQYAKLWDFVGMRGGRNAHLIGRIFPKGPSFKLFLSTDKHLPNDKSLEVYGTRDMQKSLRLIPRDLLELLHIGVGVSLLKIKLP